MNESREKAGQKAAFVAILSNCFLTVFNILVGTMSGSYALVAEGIHTLSDVATSIIAYIGFKIGQRPADDKHHYGHGRAEAISGLVIVLFLNKLLDPSLITTPDIYAALMAIFGIFINLAISKYIINIGKKINSPAIVADGEHQKTDIYSSIAILIGVIVSNMGFPILDPIIGLIIGLIILKTAYTIGKENIDNIMGKVQDDRLIKKIEKIVHKTPNAHEAHNIKVDNYGSYSVVSLHVKVDGDMTVNEAHKIVHELEKNIQNKLPAVKSVSVHTCPLGLEYNHKQKIDKK